MAEIIGAPTSMSGMPLSFSAFFILRTTARMVTFKKKKKKEKEIRIKMTMHACMRMHDLSSSQRHRADQPCRHGDRAARQSLRCLQSETHATLFVSHGNSAKITSAQYSHSITSQ
jgi:hypothetical protein